MKQSIEQSETDFFDIVDLFASEYGWTIEYIENLDISEISSLANKILIRKGISNKEQSPSKTQQEKISKLESLGILKRNK